VIKITNFYDQKHRKNEIPAAGIQSYHGNNKFMLGARITIRLKCLRGVVFAGNAIDVMPTDDQDDNASLSIETFIVPTAAHNTAKAQSLHFQHMWIFFGSNLHNAFVSVLTQNDNGGCHLN